MSREHEPLVTITLRVDRNGDIHEDTQTHGNPWSDVYRGFIAIRAEIDRQIGARRQCPFNPRYGSDDPQFAD